MSFVPLEVNPDYKVGEEYLLKRGINPLTTKLCNIVFKGPGELTNFIGGNGRCGIVFPYYDTQGNHMLYETVRWIDKKVQNTFQIIGGRNALKLSAPANKVPKPYFPPINDWEHVEKGTRVYFHESVVKAINGALLGKLSVGLNGVYGFASNKKNVPLLQEIEQLPWRTLQLQPVIVFDSNWRNNTQVMLAINRLAGALVHRIPDIAPPIHLQLPPNGDTDWGFDDARAALGDDWAREYLDSPGVGVDASPLNAARVEINSEVVFVHEVSRIVHMEEGHFYNSNQFTRAAYANRIVFTEDHRPVSVADAWLKWDHRNEVHRLVYEPGKERMSVPHWFNTWRGMGCEPKEGDVTPFLAALENNIADVDMRRWFCKWLAYPLQHLGSKVLTNVVLVGPPGTGKSWLCELMGRIYGADNYVEIGREQLESSFNSIYNMRQFININEVTRSSSREKSLAGNNKLKQLTTSPTLVVNRKGEPEWVCQNHVNIIITTNYSDGLFLDEQDRRSAVLEWKPAEDHTHDKVYWEKMYKWRDGDGPAALYGWLLSLDLTGFDASGWAPGTQAKRDMIESARSSWEVWIMDLAKNPDDSLNGGRCLFTNKELRLICANQLGVDPEKIPQIPFGTQLKAHFKPANRGGKVRGGDTYGPPERYYIIKEGDFDTHEKCQAHLRNNRIQ